MTASTAACSHAMVSQGVFPACDTTTVARDTTEVGVVACNRSTVARGGVYGGECRTRDLSLGFLVI